MSTTWIPTTQSCGSNHATISTDGLTVSGNYQSLVFSSEEFSSGTTQAEFIFEGGTAGDYNSVGIVSSTYNDPTGFPWDYGADAFAAQTNQNGVVLFNGTNPDVFQFGENLSIGGTYTFTVNADAKLGWVQQNGGPPNNNSSAYITNSPTATAAETGAIDLSALAQPWVWCAGFINPSTSGTWTAQFDIPLLFLTLESVIPQGDDPCQLVWSLSGGTADGLQYSNDMEATWHDCGGAVTGTSGAALGPPTPAGTGYVMYIRLTNDPSVTAVLIGVVPPNNAGAILASQGGLNLPSVDVTGSFIAGAESPSVVFVFTMSCTPLNGSGVTGGAAFSITGTDGVSGHSEFAYLTLGGFDGSMNGCVGQSPTIGPESVPIGLTTSVNGVIVGTSAGGSRYFQSTITNNGTLSVFNFGDQYVTSAYQFTGFHLDSSVIYPGTDCVFSYAFAIYALNDAEEITLATASYAGTTGPNATGTLTLQGEVLNAIPSAMALTLDAGDAAPIFQNPTSFTLDSAGGGGGAFTLTLAITDSVFDNGVYYLQVEDSSNGLATGVVIPPEDPLYSNVLTFVLGESIVLSLATGSIGGTVSVSGNSSGGPPAAIDISIDNGATWDEAVAYNSAAGTLQAAYTGSSTQTIAAAGTYPVVVRDHRNPSIVSNPYSLVLSEPTESITLNTPSVTIGQPLALSGITIDGPAAAMDLSLDGGQTWPQALTNYTTSSSTTQAAWSGNGLPITGFGTFPLRVRDHNTLVESNVVTISVQPAFPIWTPIQAPSQEGTSASYKPQLLTISLGDGYAQRMEDGINFNPRTQQCTWASISAANWKTITDFFEANFGSPFYYAMPGDIRGLSKWNCGGYKTGNPDNSGNLIGCTATLQQDFRPDDTVLIEPPAPPAPFATWTPPVKPSADGADLQISARMNSSNFGDNTIFQAPDGLNYITRQQALTWDMVTLADWTAIEQFLAPRLNGVPFYYAMPGDLGGTRLWTVNSLKIGTFNGDFYTGNSATLQIDFTPDPSNTNTA